MDLVLAALLLILLPLYFVYMRRKPEIQQRRFHPAPRATEKNIDALRRLEGSECIYCAAGLVLKARILQIEPSGNEVHVRLAPARAEGLSHVPDDAINLGTPLHSLQHTIQYLDAPYSGWKIYLDRKLIAAVLDLARRGESKDVIRKALLEHGTRKPAPQAAPAAPPPAPEEHVGAQAGS